MTLLATIVALGGLVAVPVYFMVTATPIHSGPEQVTSTVSVAPAARWLVPVTRASHDIRAAITEQDLPGVSVAVAADGHIVWSEGFGWADIETRAPTTPETRLRIGTTSQVFTSAAVGVLLEQGRLNLDDEIRTYVPRFPRTPWRVTLRQLM